MKFGETFRQYSIPEWAACKMLDAYCLSLCTELILDNVDYNEIKKIIKQETSFKTPQSITIPGHDIDSILSEGFEQELYDLLREEHERVELFCKSKTGEIRRRLDHLSTLIHKFQTRITLPRTSLNRLRKLSKLEESLLRLGNDVQCLSRFIGAQKLAFQKLIKKYQKWAPSRSSNLDSYFRKTVLDHSEWIGPPRDPLVPLLTRYSCLLEAVRAPFSDGMAQNSSTASSEPFDQQYSAINFGAKDLHETFETGSDVDVDAAFFSIPQGRGGGRATYWVHSDNLIQAHVLVQSFARVRGSSPRSSVSSHAQKSPQGSVYDALIARTGSPEERSTGFAVFDNAHTFAKQQSKQIRNSKDLYRYNSPRAAASIHYFQAEKFSVVALTSPFRRMRIKQKDLQRLSDQTPESPLAPNSNGCTSSEASSSCEEDIRVAKEWFEKHPQVQPLVQVHCNRTRFVGLSNNKENGLWVNFDSGVRWRNSATDTLADLGTNSNNESFEHSFPHTILEVRWEGQATPQLVQALNQNHVAERVPGFSIEVHAIATLRQETPGPSWLGRLDEDIRSVPIATQLTSRGKQSTNLGNKRPTNSSVGTSSTERPSSALLTGADQSSFTSETDHSESPFRKERRKGKRPERNWQRSLSPTSSQNAGHPANISYWNEFDDEEEQASHEPYTILVNPDENDIFSNALSSLASKLRGTSRWLSFGSSKPEKVGEQRGLLDPESNMHSDADIDSDSSENSPRSFLRRISTRQYSTFANSRSRRAKATNNNAAFRDKLLFRLSLAAFPLSLLLFVMSAVVEGTGRRRYTAQDNAVSIVGIVASIVLAVLGLFFTFGRERNADVISRASAVLAMTIMCTANGILVLVMVRGKVE